MVGLQRCHHPAALIDIPSCACCKRDGMAYRPVTSTETPCVPPNSYLSTSSTPFCIPSICLKRKAARMLPLNKDSQNYSGWKTSLSPSSPATNPTGIIQVTFLDNSCLTSHHTSPCALCTFRDSTKRKACYFKVCFQQLEHALLCALLCYHPSR